MTFPLYPTLSSDGVSGEWRAGDDDDFRFNNTSTHGGHLHQNAGSDFMNLQADLGLCCLRMKWASSSKKIPSSMLKICRFISSCTCANYHTGFCSPFIHSLVSNDSVSGQWRPWSDCANAQADLGLHCLRMSGGTFSHAASQIMSLFQWSSSNNSWKSYLNRHSQQLKKQALQQ